MTADERAERIRETVKRLTEEPGTRRAMNLLESHLGCVRCRGSLTDGRCLKCDPRD